MGGLLVQSSLDLLKPWLWEEKDVRGSWQMNVQDGGRAHPRKEAVTSQSLKVPL